MLQKLKPAHNIPCAIIGNMDEKLKPAHNIPCAIIGNMDET